MKKNIAMRLAAILFILTMISTCAFSTTFAKYVTKGTAHDTARVAKWGVELTIKEGVSDSEGTNFFVKAYDNESSPTVLSSTTDDVVAPGTANSEGITIKITGKPEVKSKISFDMTVNKDVFLKKADDTYLNWTTANTTDKFNLAEDYYPVVFTLTKQVGTGSIDKVVTVDKVVTGNLAAVEAYLEGANGTYEVAVNKDLDVTYKLTWAWAFETSEILNAADTLLGNIAAEKDTSTAYTGLYNLTLDFTINVTVEQMD